MNIQHYKLNLDLLKNTSTPVLYSHQLDKKSRFIDVTLTANDAEVTLDSTMTAVLNATTNNVIVAESQNCTISNNVIVVELTDKVLSLPGVTKCEVVLSDSSGAVITAQHFIVKITEKAINSKSKYETNGGTLATKDDINAAIEKVKDEVLTKADKADTLAGYGITDAYDKKYLDKALKDKLNKMPFDTVPVKNSPNYVTSGTLYNCVNTLNQSIAAKYDRSNFESGTGELSPAQAIYDGNEGGFNYVKNGKVVTVSVNITKLVADKSYIQMAGLPFPAKNESRFSSIAVYSTTNKLRNIRLDGSWLYISSPTDKFAEDEKINFTITYIRQ
ncbi:hypothetical protein AAAY30_07155 [Ruminococcoides bili]|jgi:hypothetical protein|uniref:hypothetical protein n=1 Tax=Ruminococcus sp. TaxID=41978 RepID=UPI00307EF8BF